MPKKVVKTSSKGLIWKFTLVVGNACERVVSSENAAFAPIKCDSTTVGSCAIFESDVERAKIMSFRFVGKSAAVAVWFVPATSCWHVR